MINGAGRVPAATVTTKTAQNNLGGGPPAPVLVKTAHLFIQNAQGIDDAIAYGAINGTLGVIPRGIFRLAFEAENTVNPHQPTSLTLAMAVNASNPDTAIYTPVTNSCSSTLACFILGTGIVNTQSAIERFPNGGRINLPCGIVQSALTLPTVTWETNSKAECQYSLQASPAATPGTTIDFRLMKEGNVLLPGPAARITILAPGSSYSGVSLSSGSLQ